MRTSDQKQTKGLDTESGVQQVLAKPLSPSLTLYSLSLMFSLSSSLSSFLSSSLSKHQLFDYGVFLVKNHFFGACRRGAQTRARYAKMKKENGFVLSLVLCISCVFVLLLHVHFLFSVVFVSIFLHFCCPRKIGQIFDSVGPK